MADANQAIIDAGLTVGNITYAHDDTMPADYVISQDPIGGTLVDWGSPVDLVVSLGPCVVPDIVGMTAADANTAITDAGFWLGIKTGDFNDTIPVGQVTSQNPAPGTAPCGSAVSYTYICRRVTCGTCKGDFNGDGWVRLGDATDFAILLTNSPYIVFNTECRYNPCCDGINGSAANSWNNLSDYTDLSVYITCLTNNRCRCDLCPATCP